jgi:hypothetical protein
MLGDTLHSHPGAKQQQQQQQDTVLDRTSAVDFFDGPSSFVTSQSCNHNHNQIVRPKDKIDVTLLSNQGGSFSTNFTSSHSHYSSNFQSVQSYLPPDQVDAAADGDAADGMFLTLDSKRDNATLEFDEKKRALSLTPLDGNNIPSFVSLQNNINNNDNNNTNTNNNSINNLHQEMKHITSNSMVGSSLSESSYSHSHSHSQTQTQGASALFTPPEERPLLSSSSAHVIAVSSNPSFPEPSDSFHYEHSNNSSRQ